MYEGVKSEVLSTTKFDDNLDLSATYLGRIDIPGAGKVKEKEKFLYQNKGIQQESY